MEEKDLRYCGNYWWTDRGTVHAVARSSTNGPFVALCKMGNKHTTFKVASQSVLDPPHLVKVTCKACMKELMESGIYDPAIKFIGTARKNLGSPTHAIKNDNWAACGAGVFSAINRPFKLDNFTYGDRDPCIKCYNILRKAGVTEHNTPKEVKVIRDTQPKIKIRMEEWGRYLVIQILEMDERFRSTSGALLEFKSTNGFFIKSGRRPHLSSDMCSVWLRGCEKVNDDVIMLDAFASPEEMKRYKNRLLKALEEWSEKWPGWQPNNIKITKDDVENVFVF